MSPVSTVPAPGLSYFFTVRLRDPASQLLTRRIGLLRHAFSLTQQAHPFTIDAAVVLPSRMHMVWTLPPHDGDYGRRWQMIKTTFARHALSRSRGLPPIWQRRFWEQPITTASERESYLQLIVEAPVAEGLVQKAEDWPYCSLARLPTQRQSAKA